MKLHHEAGIYAMHRRFLSGIVGLLLLVVLAAAGLGCREGEDSASGEESEAGPTQPVEVKAVKARLADLEPSAEWTGTLKAAPESIGYVAPQVSGQVEKILVVEGQSVHAGDAIVLLDNRLATAECSKAEADSDEATAALRLIERGPLPEEISVAKQDAQSAKVTEDALRAKLGALKPLLEKQEISPVQYQQAEAALNAASAARLSSDSKLKLLQSGSRPEAVAEAQAHAASTLADLQAKRLAVSLCTLVSPIDGTVAELQARPGMTVQPADRLATVYDLSKLHAAFRASAEALHRMSVGMLAKVTFPGSDAAVEGKVDRIGAIADAGTGDIEVLVAISNSEGFLRPGMGCRVQLALEKVSQAVVLPVTALADHDGTPVVTMVRDGKAYETPVKPGARTSTEVQILEGVNAGDVIAMEGGYSLPDECPVVVSMADAQDAPGKTGVQ